MRRFEAGLCSATEFAAGVVADWGLDLEPAAFLEAFGGWPGGPYPGAARARQAVRAGAGVGCLSNTNAFQWQAHFESTPLTEAFELRFLSFELGMVKPDREIFEAVAQRLPGPPGRVLFLDDNDVNVAGAAAAGFAARHVRGVDEARHILEGTGVLDRLANPGPRVPTCRPWLPTAPPCVSCRASATTSPSSGPRGPTASCACCAATCCGFFNHPPGPVCPRCLSRDVAPQAVSGRGHVETFTVNYQQWIPGSDTYIIAWVSIDEQPDVRLTTNLVGVEPDDVHVGMPVRVVFEHVDDVWLPALHPRGRIVSPRPSTEPLERRAIISGIGQSDVGRRLGRSDLDLTVEAALAAIADAGLGRDDIDGLSTYPGMGTGTAGFAGPPSPEVQDAMGLSLNWHDGGGEGPAQMRAVMSAALAVAAGLARHVLVYRTVTEGTAQGTGGPAGHRRALRWRRHAPVRQLHAVVTSLRRRVGRQLDRHGRAAPHARVRSDPRAAGPDRHQRAPQCRLEPEGGLHRARCRWTTTSRRA